MEALFSLAFYFFFAVSCSLICRKAGLNTFWGALAFVPVLNIVALYYVALAPWPRFVGQDVAED
jgi:hypothetical protein